MPRLRQPKESAPKASVRFEQEEETKPKDPNAPFEQEEEEPEVIVAAEKQAEKDASEDLKKQIAALKAAEQQQRERADKAERERQQARQEAAERAAEIEKTRGEVIQTRADVINRAIAAETEAAEAAEREYVAARANGDAEAEVKAQRRLARAEANLANLQNGKAAIEAEIEETKSRPAPKKEEPPQGDGLDQTTLPDTAKRWLRAHPEYLTDNRKNAKIQSLHWDVVDEGHAPFSDSYYESLEIHLGIRKAPRKEEPESEEEEANSGMVSAPVSREPPASDGSRKPGVVRLSPAQREAAKMAGITEAEYAKQLMRLQAEKDSGNYGERR